MEPLRVMGAAFNPVAAGFEVVRTFPDSPAAAAGLDEGDLVTHLDGPPIYERGWTSVSDYSGREMVKLSVRRDDSFLEMDVAVVDLVP